MKYAICLIGIGFFTGGCVTTSIPTGAAEIPPAQVLEVNAEGRILKARDYHVDGVIKATTSYYYDDLGRLNFERKVYPHSDGRQTVSETNYEIVSGVAIQTVKEYDSGGKLLNVKHFTNRPDKIQPMMPRPTSR